MSEVWSVLSKCLASVPQVSCAAGQVGGIRWSQGNRGGGGHGYRGESETTVYVVLHSILREFRDLEVEEEQSGVQEKVEYGE